MRRLNFIFMIYALLFMVYAFFFGSLSFRFIVRNFETKYINNKSLVYVEREKNIDDFEKRMIYANIEERGKMQTLNSIKIFFYLCISVFSLSLYKNKAKSKELSVIMLAAGFFLLLLTLYSVRITMFSYYNGAGDGITNILNRDKIMIN